MKQIIITKQDIRNLYGDPEDPEIYIPRGPYTLLSGQEIIILDSYTRSQWHDWNTTILEIAYVFRCESGLTYEFEITYNHDEEFEQIDWHELSDPLNIYRVQPYTQTRTYWKRLN